MCRILRASDSRSYRLFSKVSISFPLRAGDMPAVTSYICICSAVQVTGERNVRKPLSVWLVVIVASPCQFFDSILTKVTASQLEELKGHGHSQQSLCWKGFAVCVQWVMRRISFLSVQKLQCLKVQWSHLFEGPQTIQVFTWQHNLIGAAKYVNACMQSYK